MSLNFCKISDQVLDKESLIGSTITVAGQSVFVTADVLIPGEGAFMLGEGMLIFVANTEFSFEFAGLSCEAPSVGVYALDVLGSVKIDGTAMKKLGNEWLENSVMTVTFREENDGTYTADKTLDEVRAAENMGSFVVGVGYAGVEGRYMHSNPVGGPYAEFTSVVRLGDEVIFQIFKLPENNKTCEYTRFTLAKAE